MTSAELHLSEQGHPIDVHFDNGEGTPVSAFILLTTVPTDPPAGHVLAYGNSNVIGQI